jgi:hypothetical protein
MIFQSHLLPLSVHRGRQSISEGVAKPCGENYAMITKPSMISLYHDQGETVKTASNLRILRQSLVHGVTRKAVPSETWRQILCIIRGGFVGVSALMWPAAPVAASAD